MEIFDKGLKIGYGCYGLSGAYGKKLCERDKINILNAAYDMGIRYFDTASIYGHSEEILGKALGRRRNDIIISTKAGIQNNKIRISGDELLKSCESSLRRMNTDYIDIFHIHYGSKQSDIEETIEGLECLKRKGYIREYGIGHMNNEELGEYLNKGKVFSVLTELNIINSENYNYIRRFTSSKSNQLDSRTSGVKIIPFSITARGLLTGVINKNTRFLDNDIRSIDPLFNKERMKRVSKVIKDIEKLAEEHGCTMAQLSISWVTNKEGVWKALTGPTKIEHLIENVKSMDIKIDKRVLDKIDELMEAESKVKDREIYQWIKSFLVQSPNKDFIQEIKDLIYILDYCIDKGRFNGDIGLQLFTELISIKNNRGEIDNNILKLRDIKEQIKRNLEDYK
ncbi:aldo/keto reductase [Oceanirhabdus sp. W0125-5]|uniref:aldo/keto reductase n=1 Tax=Oceanirhabdus sp. W0125-5 TaxID=2999116 RepID=UPI0022F2F74E|nr:aldo/keto reductase [Oceanirhabdus sp. W0125-5]WBW97844.1 aldo/keto reductase [Oceanirhabdus sp. W0125-5]